ncbi:hypothetical protein [Microbacterium sp.]|uniref:hypothetical protein n=1 Tax=Microbacterium sp. TaxID=51671 RepID=UPI0027341E23|nr:hypothetical protein [Microbacterium sp.]MDP3949529.1 hypothetical protein [Microbacterium sp.]
MAINMFCVVPGEYRWIPIGLSIVVLGWVIAGYLPQLSCVPHAYVAFCFGTAVTVPVGGDQVAQNLALLLVPVCVTWRGRWHWASDTSNTIGIRELVAWCAVALVMVQASVIYAVSFISKLAVTEWVDGTVIYYWFQDQIFGPAGWGGDVLRALSFQPIGTAVLTFGTLALEAGLAVAIFVRGRARAGLLIAGIAFHGAIALTMGLISFGLAMTALLLLYLGDLGPQPRTWPFYVWRTPTATLRSTRDESPALLSPSTQQPR